MEIITREDGTELAVYTEEELEQQKQEAIEKYKEENPDQTAELVKLEEELQKIKKKDLNFADLRKQKEAAEKQIADIIADVDEKIVSAKKEVLESVLQDHYANTLKQLSGEDDELKKKIEFHYKRITDVASSKEEVANKLRDAWVLAAAPPPDSNGALDTTVISSGGVRRVDVGHQKAFSADEKALASKLGISEEDLTKYGQ